MNPRVLVIALALAVLVLGGGWYLIQQSAVHEGAASVASPAATSPARDTPRAAPERPAAAPARAGSPRVAGASPESAAPSGAASATPARPSATRGTLHVTSDVPNALVFLDRTYAGTAPVTIPNILLGPHKVNVSLEGFEGASQEVEIVAGAQDVEVRLREVHLKASVAVVHTHRTGSCMGQLIATPQGMRYETADPEDGFSVALNDLELFDVDYLKKNLRVKLRGGKTYNFTEPEGNADRLFVFQRDVEKARARLAKGDAPAS